MRRDRPRVVIVAHFCPFPAVHGNRSRFVGLLEWFRANGIAVTFILQPLDVEGSDGLTQLRPLVDRLEVVRAPGVGQRLATWGRRGLRSLARVVGREAVRHNRGSGEVGADGHIDRWCWPATSRAVERAVRRDRPIAVIAEYALLSRCLEGLPDTVLKVIDTVEVFFRNRERFETVGLDAPVVCTPDSEVDALGRADLLIAIQGNDAKVLKEQFPRTRVITVPHAYRQISRGSAAPARGSVLYVGSSNPFNVHGLREFVAHAWPSIRERVPGATLRIVGSVPEEDHPAGSGVVHVGRVSDAELAKEYQTAHAVINPQVAGTGLKIKCVEALSAGCPLVANSAGADGIEEGEGRAFLMAKDWRGFADHVVTVLTDEECRLGLEAEARAFAGRVFSPAAAFAELVGVFSPSRSAR